MPCQCQIGPPLLLIGYRRASDSRSREEAYRDGKGRSEEPKQFFPLWLSFEDFSRRPWNLEISHTGHIVYTSHKSEQHFCSWVQVAEIVLSSRGRQTGTVPSLISSGFCASALDKRRLWRRVGGLKGMLRMGFENEEISRQMEAIRGPSNLAEPAHMISHRDVNQKWLSIWRGGERHCQLVTTWLVCTGQEWSLFEYGSCRDRISPELSYQSVPWLITGIASELLGIREGGSFSKPQNENYDLVHPLWWCGYIHKHLFSLTLAGTQHLLLGGCVCVRISFPTWN